MDVSALRVFHFLHPAWLYMLAPLLTPSKGVWKRAQSTEVAA